MLVRLWFRRDAGSLRPERGEPMPRRLLFVCHGNILRSAFASALIGTLRERGDAPPDTISVSAGTHAIDGRAADPRGVRVALELGVPLVQHRATLISADLIDAADLVLVMDRVNEAEILARFPVSRTKVQRLAAYLSNPAGGDIADPYGGDEESVRAAFGRIEQAVRGLLAAE